MWADGQTGKTRLRRLSLDREKTARVDNEEIAKGHKFGGEGQK